MEFGDSRLPPRFWAKVKEDSSGCWLWQGATLRGYGQLYWRGRTVYAHSLAHEIACGVIAKGLERDHLCRKPACCNPAHIEAVTHAENTRRGMAGAYNLLKTTCRQGHPFDRVRKTNRREGTGTMRGCSICEKEYFRLRYQASKEGK